jgi:hypothetical protein
MEVTPAEIFKIEADILHNMIVRAREPCAYIHAIMNNMAAPVTIEIIERRSKDKAGFKQFMRDVFMEYTHPAILIHCLEGRYWDDEEVEDMLLRQAQDWYFCPCCVLAHLKNSLTMLTQNYEGEIPHMNRRLTKVVKAIGKETNDTCLCGGLKLQRYLTFGDCPFDGAEDCDCDCKNNMKAIEGHPSR